MDKVMLRLRDLTSGDPSTKEFESFEQAGGWLKQRPSMTEVLGVVFEGLTREQNDGLRQAMRPLDDQEKSAMERLDALEREEREKRNEAKRKELEASESLQKEASEGADVDRPMEVEYRYDKTELLKTDRYDQRPVTAAIDEAVKAWVAERMEWVADRGQTIGQAKVTCYPNEVPKGKDRVVSGSFIPVTAAPKGEN